MVPKQIIQILFLNSLSTALLEGFPLFFRLRILAAHLPDVPLKEPDPLLAEGKPTQPHPSSSPSRVSDLWEVGHVGADWAVGITWSHWTSLFSYERDRCSNALVNLLIRKMEHVLKFWQGIHGSIEYLPFKLVTKLHKNQYR